MGRTAEPIPVGEAAVAGPTTAYGLGTRADPASRVAVARLVLQTVRTRLASVAVRTAGPPATEAAARVVPTGAADVGGGPQDVAADAVGVPAGAAVVEVAPAAALKAALCTLPNTRGAGQAAPRPVPPVARRVVQGRAVVVGLEIPLPDAVGVVAP